VAVVVFAISLTHNKSGSGLLCSATMVQNLRTLLQLSAILVYSNAAFLFVCPVIKEYNITIFDYKI